MAEDGTVIYSCRTEGVTFEPSKKKPPVKKRIHTKESVAISRMFIGTQFKGKVGDEYQ